MGVLCGSLKLPSADPLDPHFVMNLPSAENFSTLELPVSVT